MGARRLVGRPDPRRAAPAGGKPPAPAELDLDPDRAPVIRDIFDRALQGVAPAPMARQLNAEGLRTAAGGPWTRRRVQDTLANPVYAGLLVRYRGTDREERQPARHPAIVTPEEFEAVQVSLVAATVRLPGAPPAGAPHGVSCSPAWHAAGAAGHASTRAPRPTCARTAHARRKYECAQVTDGTGLCDAPPLDAVSVDALVLERLPRFWSAADRWLRELGSDRRAVEARAERELTAAERSAATLARASPPSPTATCHEPTVDIHTPEAEALLGALVDARGAHPRSAPRRARRGELAAVREALEGDALAVAYRSLHDALHGGEAGAVAASSITACVSISTPSSSTPTRAPLPIWKLEMPDPLARHLADTLDAPDVAAYIERRVTELGLRDPLSETSRHTQRVALDEVEAARVRGEPPVRARWAEVELGAEAVQRGPGPGDPLRVRVPVPQHGLLGVRAVAAVDHQRDAVGTRRRLHPVEGQRDVRPHRLALPVRQRAVIPTARGEAGGRGRPELGLGGHVHRDACGAPGPCPPRPWRGWRRGRARARSSPRPGR